MASRDGWGRRRCISRGLAFPANWQGPSPHRDLATVQGCERMGLLMPTSSSIRSCDDRKFMEFVVIESQLPPVALGGGNSTSIGRPIVPTAHFRLSKRGTGARNAMYHARVIISHRMESNTNHPDLWLIRTSTPGYRLSSAAEMKTTTPAIASQTRSSTPILSVKVAGWRCRVSA